MGQMFAVEARPGGTSEVAAKFYDGATVLFFVGRSLTALTAQQLPADCSRHRRIHDIAHVEIAAPPVVIHLPLSFERPLKYICPEKEGVGSVLNVIAVYWAGQMMLIFVMDVNLGLSRQKIFS